MTETVLRAQLMLFALLMSQPPWWRPFRRRAWRRNSALIFAALAGAVNVALVEEAANLRAVAGMRTAVGSMGKVN